MKSNVGEWWLKFVITLWIEESSNPLIYIVIPFLEMKNNPKIVRACLVPIFKWHVAADNGWWRRWWEDENGYGKKKEREKKNIYEMMRRKEEKKWLWLVRGMRKEKKNGFHGNGPNGMVVCVRERERISIGGRKDLKNCQIYSKSKQMVQNEP